MGLCLSCQSQLEQCRADIFGIEREEEGWIEEGGRKDG